MKNSTVIHRLFGVLFTLMLCGQVYATEHKVYDNLVALFKDWRVFEKAPMFNGAPDYRQGALAIRYKIFQKYKDRLHKIDLESLTLAQKVDWYIVFAEMNGYEFNHGVLKPWARDPAFYKTIWMNQSDVPAHEGPTHHALTEVWHYDFPLTKSQQEKLASDISVIAPLMAQAKQNLIGNAKELWIAGIKDIKQQSLDLDTLIDMCGDDVSEVLKTNIAQAKTATDDLVVWLQEMSKQKTGPSGIGIDQYNWHQKYVRLMPLSWEQEVTILKRELSRAWTALKLEEQRNRHLPPLEAAATPRAFDLLTEKSIKKLIDFLGDQQIVTVADYFEPALRAQRGRFIPEKQRNFFYIGMHYDPLPLYSHFYHWFELARMENDPHPSEIRKGAVLYNIFDSRNEGTATAVEEMFLQAGLYDDNPRARELVWIMIAQRAARGLGSLYAHANLMTMEEAGNVHSEWTPRGWMKTEKELLLFEQHLYLRQPGYGTSYITGKYLLEEIMAYVAQEKDKNGESFVLKDFFDELNATGNIPISLVRWQMTGTKPTTLVKPHENYRWK